MEFEPPRPGPFDYLWFSYELGLSNTGDEPVHIDDPTSTDFLGEGKALFVGTNKCGLGPLIEGQASGGCTAGPYDR